jgi:hypothetical protein
VDLRSLPCAVAVPGRPPTIGEGVLMALYHLDPRQAGNAPPDVEVYRAYDALGKPFFARRVHESIGGFLAEGKTEAAALAAARTAAGFAHVAEQPCEAFQHEPDTGACTHAAGDCGDCFECSWPRGRHEKGAR